ncbi:MAG: glycoside hydrolase, partial [Anaerolineae bacterium]|nr:glycoside hydrolase [Anaerolineae bacterium]
RVLITSAPNDAVMAYVRAGGRALILQQGEGGLPVLPRPFWRESIKLIYDHPVWDGSPHQGYVDLQFYHLATDYALDSDHLNALPDVTGVTPILRRLDVRLFTLSDYLVELRIGSGIALASTLRFGGGAGDQVHGLDANVAGRYLLGQLVQYLAGA